MMFVTHQFFAAAAAAALASAAAVPSTQGSSVLKRDDNCSSGPGWAPVNIIGGSDQNHFCETHWKGNYAPIVGIEAWRAGDKDGSHVAGIRFQYASDDNNPDWSQTYGLQDTSKYSSTTLSLQAGETITSAVLYGDGKGEKFGHLDIETSRGQSYKAGRDTNNIHPYPLNVGSGILLGAVGSTASDVDQGVINLGLLFLGQSVDSIEVKDVQYDTSKLDNQGKVNPNQITVGTYYNKYPLNVTANQSQQFSVTKSHTFSQASTNKFGITNNIEFSAEVLGIGAKRSMEFSWEKTDETTNEMSTQATTSTTCSFSAPILPQHGVKGTGTFANGTTTMPYSSNVVVHLKNGGTYSYPEKGQVTSASYVDCVTTISEDNDPSLPANAQIVNPPSGGQPLK